MCVVVVGSVVELNIIQRVLVFCDGPTFFCVVLVVCVYGPLGRNFPIQAGVRKTVTHRPGIFHGLGELANEAAVNAAQI